jgi:hypothetical protein
VGDDIAARVDELTVITPEVLDNFELALRDIYPGRTFHADIDVVKVATEKTFTDRESNPPLVPISGQWHCVNPQDWNPIFPAIKLKRSVQSIGEGFSLVVGSEYFR